MGIHVYTYFEQKGRGNYNKHDEFKIFPNIFALFSAFGQKFSFVVLDEKMFECGRSVERKTFNASSDPCIVPFANLIFYSGAICALEFFRVKLFLTRMFHQCIAMLHVLKMSNHSERDLAFSNKSIIVIADVEMRRLMRYELRITKNLKSKVENMRCMWQVMRIWCDSRGYLFVKLGFYVMLSK